ADAPGPAGEVEAAPAAAAPAVPEPVAAPPAPPLPETRTGIPRWMMPVLVVLPFWALIYVGAFGTTKKPAAPTSGPALGALLYHGKAGCAGCHGAKGEGGVGPALANGDAKLTFPDEADHISWVSTGSAPFRGKKYGATQHGPATGGMPAFKGVLTDAEIIAVVEYERTQL
ncbi:MAG: cytochrome c class, partial [Acidimicrobiales bacterium]|nr:cytochrome c class [Acidimicrobiales bacterium]